ncbi:formate dehydrogenase [Chelatococcus sp. SYSU_G07232]|uniref:Formate dehydrogenase n=1 Tax=Chelatococcus albus TaxID=3047466 RepID=A0ABT7AJQ8_9HYPH|nr:formate dehydrogenase [Chelatococcus sp. SYSU_G07232]MDJ1159618.1 formate dehydrogenase [Chelatococcus sp. SYSU_G07232]
MSDKKKPEGLDRRGFLRAMGAGAAVTAAVPLTATEAQAMKPPGDEGKARYRESEHVKTFYKVNRY